MLVNSISGSNWNIWDLHVHSPASFGGNDYDTFISNLAVSVAAVIGINDYCTIEGYKKIMEKGGVPNKIIFPVVEFRMHNIVANRKGISTIGGVGTKINFHVIFSNDPALFPIIETFINSLSCYNASGREAQLGGISATELMKLTFDLPSVQKKIKELSLEDHCLVWLPYDEYGGIDDIDPEDNFFKLHLVKEANIMGSSREKQIEFFKWKDPKFTDDQYRQFMDSPKPCIKGSDSHEIDYPFGKLKNEKSEPIEKFCWIKGDLTFNGLKQIVYEPDRVFIGKEPELIQRMKSYPHKFIKALKVNKETGARTAETWFENIEIGFNAGLIALIGKKGNGKSAIADIIGLCANSKNQKEDLSFLHKDKFKNPRANKAKEFKGKLVWLDRNDSGEINLANDINLMQEERVKYIPQNYLEKLCVNEEQIEFEEELKKIIFSHIPGADRLGQNSLDELLLLKQKPIEEGIGKLQLDVARVNKEIVRLETKKKDTYQAGIKQEISNKSAELSHHDGNKPKEKPRPEEDETQKIANKTILAEIEKHQAARDLAIDQKKTLENELSTNNISINELDGLKNEFSQLNNLISKSITEKKLVLEKHSIEVKDVITYSIDVTKIASKIDGLKSRNNQINLSISGNETSKGLIDQIAQQTEIITDFQSKLAQSQKDYQEYLQTKEAWDRRKLEIIGTPESVGSLKYYQNELNYITEKLNEELTKAYDQRLKTSIEIFSLKLQLLQIYSTLYQPITQVLEKESSFVEEYNIKVNASLSIRGFSDRFISFINQKSRGTYAGTTEGREMIDQLLAMHSVSNNQEVESLLTDILNSLRIDKRQGYNAELRYPDEQLKRDMKIEDLYDFIYGLDFIDPQFKLQLGTKDLKELSPGERGAILLIFYLFLDIDNKPLIIDQPEENLDNESIYYYLVHFIKKAKQKRQIILITHNPNLAVVCDAEQIIHMAIDKQHLNRVSFQSGAIENPEIAKRVINILEGTKPAFDNRRLKYASIVS
jgi:ABC-type lipoprotein export system ATPase subunit